MTPVVLFALLGATYAPDAYVICGPEPKEVCLTWVDQCLRDASTEGAEPDVAFEWCAEGVDPSLVNWGPFPNWPPPSE